MPEPPANKRCRLIEEDDRVFQRYWNEILGVIVKDNKTYVSSVSYQLFVEHLL